MPRTSTFEPRPAEGLTHRNALALFMARCERAPSRVALRFKRDGAWRSMTWQEWREASLVLARAFVALADVRPGERVAVMCSSRVEWLVFDLAATMLGAVSVPVYPTLPGEEISFILEDSGAVALLVEHPGQLRRLLSVAPEGLAAALRTVLCVDLGAMTREGDRLDLNTLSASLRDADSCRVHSYERALEVGAQAAQSDPSTWSAYTQAHLDDAFSIVYTSGTTATPKGVVISHKNLVYEAWAIKNTIAVDHTDEQLVILPLAHIFARHMVWAGIESGSVAAFPEDIDHIWRDLKELAPTFVGAAPRLFEKAHAMLQKEIERAGILRAIAIRHALDVGHRVGSHKQRGEAIPWLLNAEFQLADRLVLAELRAAFGGRMRFFISGAAPLPIQLAEFFLAIGLLVLEGYGLTESTGAACVNRPDRFRFGSVGPALPGCEILIADDGEVLLRGHNIMSGYYQRNDETAAVIDERGWLHTGDIGEISEGYLRITDRKKDVIITAGGKNIAPSKLEDRLRARPGISHVLVHGDRRPYLVALVTVDEAWGMALSEREGLGCNTYRDLVSHPRVRRHLQEQVDWLNAHLASYENLKSFAVPPTDFSERTGDLTPTMKVRRRFVEERYADLLSSLYEAGRSRAVAPQPDRPLSVR